MALSYVIDFLRIIHRNLSSRVEIINNLLDILNVRNLKKHINNPSRLLNSERKHLCDNLLLLIKLLLLELDHSQLVFMMKSKIRYLSGWHHIRDFSILAGVNTRSNELVFDHQSDFIDWYRQLMWDDLEDIVDWFDRVLFWSIKSGNSTSVDLFKVFG